MNGYDTLICNGKIVDGSGNPWFYGDVAIRDERIVAIAPPGAIPHDQAAQVIDAAGLAVAPGFFDILSHSILSLMVDGRSLSKIMQGVTTEIMGEGWTPAPFIGRGATLDYVSKHSLAKQLPDWLERMQGWTRFRDWLEAMVEHGVSPNIGSFLGGGSLRRIVRGMEMGPSSPEEIAAMQQVMREAMEDGAFGLSEALIYPPSAYVETAEIIEMVKVVGEWGGLYITHLRSEADGLLEALDEAIAIGRGGGAPVEIYHIKAAGERNWPKMPRMIERIDQARREGVDITADLYPYTGAGTGLASVLPPWASSGDGLFHNLRDPEMRAHIRAEALSPSGDWEAMADLCGPEGITPVGLDKAENQGYVGKSLAEIGAMRGQEWVDSAMDLILSEEQYISTIYHMMSEENLRLELRQPWVTISTDAGGHDPAWAKAMGPIHPRAYGTYPRVLGKYVREEGVISLEEAVRKMSWAVASRLGIRDRGLLQAGNYADVVIFDPETIGDRATFTEPHQLSVGVRDVWINGVRVLAGGVHTGATPGRIVRGRGGRS
jgi:dihydroorotase/N-acyl-D-amino-acid deacylase